MICTGRASPGQQPDGPGAGAPPPSPPPEGQVRAGRQLVAPVVSRKTQPSQSNPDREASGDGTLGSAQSDRDHSPAVGREAGNSPRASQCSPGAHTPRLPGATPGPATWSATSQRRDRGTPRARYGRQPGAGSLVALLVEASAA
jgi:hypothetical protein